MIIIIVVVVLLFLCCTDNSDERKKIKDLKNEVVQLKTKITQIENTGLPGSASNAEGTPQRRRNVSFSDDSNDTTSTSDSSTSSTSDSTSDSSDDEDGEKSRFSITVRTNKKRKN